MRANDGLGLLHVDMDAFFVAVEVQADPSLAGRPVIVGGAGPRGVVASCSYEARAFGVHSAMPSAEARRLCPTAVFLPGRYDAYAAASRRLHGVLESFTPLVEGVALDEAYLDVRGANRLFGDAPTVAWRIRAAVAADLGLQCSVGVARSKLLAKLASKAAKPRAAAGGTVPGPGVVVVAPDDELAFLHPLPVRALWGVGPVAADRLARLGVSTVGDLALVPPATLVSSFGRAVGRHLHELAWGRDDRAVEPNRAAKSIGHEETYAADLVDRPTLEREVLRLAEGVASRLRQAGRAGRTVTLKVRFGDFSTVTRSRTLARPLAEAPAIAGVAKGLLADVDVGAGVRLLGVAVAGLDPAEAHHGARQLSFEDADASWLAASAAVDAVRERFGDQAVGPASLTGDGQGLDLKQVGHNRWGPGGRRRRP
ncbi:MAG TPA: DNA polymerase IV [Acidimicrobiales bacterium]|nr:DNA polymerase IV [Acidimicrobiales bacterium]